GPHRPRLQKTYFFLDAPSLRGSLAPAFRAFESPIAIACLRLDAFFPDRPLLRVPRFRSCIACLTSCSAFLPYLAILYPPVQTDCKRGSRATCQANGVNITLHISKAGRAHDRQDTAKFFDQLSLCVCSLTHADSANAACICRSCGHDAHRRPCRSIPDSGSAGRCGWVRACECASQPEPESFYHVAFPGSRVGDCSGSVGIRPGW